MNAITPKGVDTSIVRLSSDIWSRYLAALDASDRTRDTYRKALSRYRAYLADTGSTWDESTRETVIAYKTALAESPLSPHTVNAYLAAVRSFYAWTESERIYPNVARTVRGLKCSRNAGKEALTVEQSRRVLLPNGSTLKAKRDRAIIALMLTRGLRCVEVTRANIGDVSSNGGKCVLYVQGKGRADRLEYVILDGLAEQALSAYLAERAESDPNAPLFASTANRNRGQRMTTRAVSGIAKAALRDAGIDSTRVTAHSLRHTAVTLSLIGGASVQEAQALARHADISTTMIYAHNLERMKAVPEQAIDRVLGLF